MVATIVIVVLWGAVALIERSHRWSKTWRTAASVVLILLISYTGISVEDWYEKESAPSRCEK